MSLRRTFLILLSLLLVIFLNACQDIQGLEKNLITKNTKIGNEVELPFDCITVSGENALETCLRLREYYKGKITPVILGKFDDLQTLADVFTNNKGSTEDIIKKSLEYKAENLIKRRLEEDIEFYNSIELGEWPSTLSPNSSITANKDILTGKFLEKVYIGLIPTGNPYEVPAYVKFGGWNACPAPEEQVAILRYWYDKYGAQVISMTFDIIECTVENPPKTKEESLALAKEQFIYCSDIVTQGTGTISDLADSLYKSKYWFFWWD